MKNRKARETFFDNNVFVVQRLGVPRVTLRIDGIHRVQFIREYLSTIEISRFRHQLRLYRREIFLIFFFFCYR